MTDDTFPAWRGKMEYICQHCNEHYPGDQLYYTCPKCGGVLLLHDTRFSELKKKSGNEWRAVFDSRRMTDITALKGIFRFYELMAPVFSEEDIIYLGEAHTPVIEASKELRNAIGLDFAFKNEGQNPSASFKDRGMACAFSCLKWLCRIYNWEEVLTICASTGDTSAAAALYASYVGAPLKSVVILPEGKVTPQQLSQPLGSGATVIETPGVFDDCMKIVELLAEKYRVALLNSKNSWRILGQESYAFEVAQLRKWDVRDLCVFVPIGNAGNITAIMSGFLKMLDLGIIEHLPRIFGVQSKHADPVYRFFAEPSEIRQWKPVKVRPSVAQAAMIGNPVSFPRVFNLASHYREIAGEDSFNVIHVSETAIMEAMLLANRHGHIACTQGGECLAGLKYAKKEHLVSENEFSILDSTAHMLKFINFQNKYFQKELVADYGIESREELINAPVKIMSHDGKSKYSDAEFFAKASEEISHLLHLVPRTEGLRHEN